MFLLSKKLMVIFLLIGVFSISLFAIPKGCEHINENDTLNGLTSKDRVCIVAVVAESMNGTLPTTVDKMTTLTNVTGMQDTLNYKYSVNFKNSNINMKNMKSIAKMLDEGLTNANCTTPEVRNLIDLDIELEHNYYDDKGIFLFRITVDKTKCNSLKL